MHNVDHIENWLIPNMFSTLNNVVIIIIIHVYTVCVMCVCVICVCVCFAEGMDWCMFMLHCMLEGFSVYLSVITFIPFQKIKQ